MADNPLAKHLADAEARIEQLEEKRMIGDEPKVEETARAGWAARKAGWNGGWPE